MPAEDYLQATVRLTSGKEICGHCSYQSLFINESGEYADFSRQECEDIREDCVLRHGINGDVPCGLAAREVMKLAGKSGEIDATA